MKQLYGWLTQELPLLTLHSSKSAWSSWRNSVYDVTHILICVFRTHSPWIRNGLNIVASPTVTVSLQSTPCWEKWVKPEGIWKFCRKYSVCWKFALLRLSLWVSMLKNNFFLLRKSFSPVVEDSVEEKSHPRFSLALVKGL